MKKVILSFIKYRLIRIRKLTKNRIYLIFKYVLYLYIKFKIKCGWYQEEEILLYQISGEQSQISIIYQIITMYSSPTLIHKIFDQIKINSDCLLAWLQIEVKLFCISVCTSPIIDGRVEIWPLYRESYDIRWQWIDQYIKIE